MNYEKDYDLPFGNFLAALASLKHHKVVSFVARCERTE